MTTDSRFSAPDSAEATSITRRLALKRLGLAAGAVYLAPTVLGLNHAEAAPPWDKPSKPDKPDKPEKPSKPSSP